MAATSIDNQDLLLWFTDDERSDCSHCGEPAAVSLPAVAACFCLGCSAITIDGIRLDVGSRIRISPS